MVLLFDNIRLPLDISTLNKHQISRQDACFRMTRYRIMSFLGKEMLVTFLTAVALASYADKYILNPSGYRFATSTSEDLAVGTSSEVINILPSGFSEEGSDTISQDQMYIQGLINKREALVAKKGVLQKFSSQTPKAILAIRAIQQQIDEIESKIQQAPILYDVVDADLTS